MARPSSATKGVGARGASGAGISPILAYSVLIVLLLGLPMVLSWSMATVICIMAIAASAFGLMLGQAGMMSFGQSAFFAIGAYAAGYAIKAWGLTLIPTLVFGSLLGGLAAVFVGLLTVRLRDVYFILMTLAFAQLVYFAALTWRDVTGGPSGLSGFERPELAIGVTALPITSPVALYAIVAALLLAVFSFRMVLMRAPFGLSLMAMKDNPDRLRAIGHAVWAYRLWSFAVGGMMTGLAGALYAVQWQLVPTSLAGIDQSAAIAFMSILGGVGHPLGPILGAGIYIWLSDIVSNYWARWPILFGLVIIAVALFLRGGVVQIVSRALRRGHGA